MWYDPNFPIDEAAAKGRALEKSDHSVEDDNHSVHPGDDQQSESNHSADSNVDQEAESLHSAHSREDQVPESKPDAPEDDAPEPDAPEPDAPEPDAREPDAPATDASEDKGPDPELPSVRSIASAALATAISNANCVVTTCASAESDTIRQNFFPRVVMDDEAGYGHFLEAKATLISRIERGELALAVFIGDTKQLRPVVTSKYVKKADESDFNPFWDQLQTPWFAQLEDAGLEVTMFREQNRMAPGLAEFSNLVFYDGKLRDSPQTDWQLRPTACSVRGLLQYYFKLPVQHSFAMFNVPHGVTVTTSSTSRVNHQNMAVTWHIIALMLRRHVCQAMDITIVTPYSAQVVGYTRATKALIAGFNKERPTIDVDFSGIGIRTVDSFQGGEASVVFSDMVVAKMREGNPGFITDPRRLNVALTRGRDATIVVGDTDVFLEQDAKAVEKRLKDNPEQTVKPQFDATVKNVLRRMFQFYRDNIAIFQYSETDIAKFATLRFIGKEATEDDERDILKKYACNACGELGHQKDGCPHGGKQLTHRFTKCKGCEGWGHIKSECPQGWCRKCSKPAALCRHVTSSKCFGNGHTAKRCKFQDKRTCVRCGGIGHIAGPDCPYPRPKNTAPWSDLPLKAKPSARTNDTATGTDDVPTAQPDADAMATAEANPHAGEYYVDDAGEEGGVTDVNADWMEGDGEAVLKRDWWLREAILGPQELFLTYIIEGGSNETCSLLSLYQMYIQCQEILHLLPLMPDEI